MLPLISPEKGAQLGFVAQGMLLVVSGVYYPVTVMPGWMEWLAELSPATYALEGIRAAVLDGAGLGELAGTCGRWSCSAWSRSRSASRCSARASATPSATASSSGAA